MSDEAAAGRSAPDFEMAASTAMTTTNRNKSRLRDLFHRNKNNAPSTASSTYTLGGPEQQNTQSLPIRTTAQLQVDETGTPPTQNLPQTEEATALMEADLELPEQRPVIQSPVVAQAIRPIAEVWDEAWDALDPALANSYEKYIDKESHTVLVGLISAQKSATSFLRLGNTQKYQLLRQLVDQKTKELEDDKWKAKFKGNEFAFKDIITPAVGVVEWAKDYIGSAANASPYTSVAWAGVSLLLPLLLNPGKQDVARAKGLEKIAGLLRKCTIREEVYKLRYERGKQDSTKALSQVHDAYRKEVKELYTLILTFEATCLRYLLKNSAEKLARDMAVWDDWDKLSAQIVDQDAALEELEKKFDNFKLQEEWEHQLLLHEEQIEALELIGRETTRLRKLIEDAQKNSERTELLRWLCTVDPSLNYNSAWKEHESSTGNWLVKKNLQYQDWKHSPNSFLWLHGKAGAGKSFLSASVIHDLETLVYKNPGHALAYFYFSFSDTEKQNTENMLCSIIQQLCAARLDTPKALLDLRFYKDKNQRPHIDSLETTINEALQVFNQVYIVLDALDECPLKERQTLLATLDHLHKQGKAPVHLFCTSRNETDIRRVFEKFNHQLKFNLEELKKEIDADIGLFVVQWIIKSKFNSCNDRVKVEIKKILVEKADGMFRYVALQLDALQTCSTATADVIRTLNGMPKGLDKIYERILKGLHESRQEQVFRLLSWMAFSKRPLSLIELAEAAVMNPAGNLNPDKRFSRPQDVLDDVTTLVTVFSKSEFPFDKEQISEQDLCVRFAHFSVQEYLTSERIKTSKARNYSIDHDSANLLIANSCLYYHIQASQDTILHDVISMVHEKRDVVKFPLWRYAAEHWMATMEVVCQEFWPAILRERAKTVLTKDADTLLYMVIIHDPSKTYLSTAIELNELATPLFYVSAAGCPRLLTMLWQDKSPEQITDEINAVWDHAYATALQAACYFGRVEVVKLLIEQHADINVQGGEYGNALQAAVWGGDHTVVELLLERGADVNAQGGRYGNALQAAASAGDHQMAGLLLERGAGVNAQGGQHGSALQAAAWVGDLTMIELLLKRGADVNAQGGVYGNALQAAAVERSLAVVKLLLENGADVNAQGGGDSNALLATVNGLSSYKAPVLSLLLDYGAEVDTSGKEGTALQKAIATGKFEVVQLLLSHSAH